MAICSSVGWAETFPLHWLDPAEYWKLIGNGEEKCEKAGEDPTLDAVPVGPVVGGANLSLPWDRYRR